MVGAGRFLGNNMDRHTIELPVANGQIAGPVGVAKNGAPVYPAGTGMVLKQIQDFVLYDTSRLIIGTALPAGTSRILFSVALNQNWTPFNTATSFTKTKYDTNMLSAGQLPKGYFMEIYSIQFDLMAPLSLDTTPIGTAATVNPTRSTDASTENQITAQLNQIHMTFFVDNREYENGTLIQYPSQFNVSGNGFSGATTVVGGVMGNGYDGRLLSIPHWLNEEQRFGVRIEALTTLTVVQQIDIRCCLVGRLFTPVG
jgi:hypothetical protein